MSNKLVGGVSTVDEFLVGMKAQTSPRRSLREEFEPKLISPRGAYLNLRCADCGTKRLGPILHDYLWNLIAEKRSFLCLGCIEFRLGRQLTRSDLRDCQANAGWLPYDESDSLSARLARGRCLL